MMKYFWRVVFVFMVLAVPVGERAEAHLDCSTFGILAQINVAINDYDATVLATSTTPDALANIAVLHAAIEHVMIECQAVFDIANQPEMKQLYQDLQAGGYIIYVRHTHTDRSNGDTDLAQCETQRNLSDLGRDQARDIYTAYAQLDLPISRLISTEYCRTHETAILAFGQPEIITRAELSADLVEMLGTEPEAGTNWIIVAHIGTLDGAIGLPDTFEEGDSLVFRPMGDGEFEYHARIALADWPRLAQVVIAAQ